MKQVAFETRRVESRKRRQGGESFSQSFAWVMNDQIRIELQLEAHPIARGTGSLTAVKRKQPGIEGLVPNAAAVAEQALVVDLLAALRNKMDHSISQA